MKTTEPPNQEEFDRLLAWLDPDRERAGEKYENIRRKLIKIFAWRGCTMCEDLADETINRVIKKTQEVGESYVGDPALYFYGVARNVHREYMKKDPIVLPPPQPDPPQQKEQQYQCLETCMEHLSEENRQLVLEYYREEKRTKIDQRKAIADRLGIAPNGLRMRMYRIRTSLQGCVDGCLNQALAQ